MTIADLILKLQNLPQDFNIHIWDETHHRVLVMDDLQIVNLEGEGNALLLDSALYNHDNDDIVEDADIDTWLEFGDDAFGADFKVGDDYE